MGNEATATSHTYLQLNRICKSFGTTRALNDMNLEVRLGEVLGLVGPNGAGKSTLMKIITGVHLPTSGTVVLDNKRQLDASYSPNVAREIGISCAYQELSLLSNLTVYENFMINLMDHQPFGRPGWRRRAVLQTQDYLDSIFPGHGIDVRASVSDLPLPQRQMIEITKAASHAGLKLLILDEPTSSLTADRIGQLHEAMRELAATGVAIVYISHKLDEIERVCDRVVVMKSGRTHWSAYRSETSMHDLVEILGGQVQAPRAAVKQSHELSVTIEITGLSTESLRDIRLNVRQGEMVGLSGLAGAGQDKLIGEIFAASRKRRHPAIRLTTNASYVSGDRQTEGIFPLWNIADNTLISNLGKVASWWMIRKRRFNALASFWYDKLKFTAQGIFDDITSLSGGNQQKALLARCLAADSGLILLNDPTSGVDVETKQEIYRLLEEAKLQGKAILLHSTEDLEMEQCDRVYVMHEGRIVEELVGDAVSVQNIIKTSFREKSKGVVGASGEPSSRMAARRGGFITRGLSNPAFLGFAALVVIYFINALYNHRIASYLGLQLLYSSAVPLVFIALGQMFMVIAGGIDLGNGTSVGLMNVIGAFVLSTIPGLGVAYCLLLVLAYAGLGAIIYFTKIPSIVITLGASFVWLGVALIIGPEPGGHAPGWLLAFSNFSFPVIPMPIVIAIAAAAGAYWVVRRWKYGMIINAMGSNPAAVSRAGWSQLTALLVAYGLSGLMVAVGGLMLTAVSNSGDANSTASYTMLSVATIILGGCAFQGGISSPVGVVAAALAISSISFLLTFVGINSNLQSAVTGLILIGALALKLLSGRIEAKR